MVRSIINKVFRAFGLMLLIVAPLQVHGTFGKTHFIIGMPADALHVKEKPRQTTLGPFICHEDGNICQPFFAPDDNLKDVLLQLINHERKSISIAVYTFTDGDIAKALTEAQKRGVQVLVITDPSALRDRFSKLADLCGGNVMTLVYDTNYTGRPQKTLGNLMHNKFAIFGDNFGGKKIVWTGSFNFTKSGAQSNQENVLVVSRPEVIERYNAQFGRLKQRCKRCVLRQANNTHQIKKTTQGRMS